MTHKRRVALFLLFWSVQFLYLPLNHMPRGAYLPITPLDAYIPLWPIWTFVYASAIGWWAIGGLWAVWKMDERSFRGLIVGGIFAALTGVACFIFFPTYVVRPALIGHDLATELLRFFYSTDQAYNALPSGHVYLTAIYSFFYMRWRPRERRLWIAVVVGVSLSTLFTHQHYLLDVLGGLLLAWAGYRLGSWWADWSAEGRRPLRLGYFGR